mgnify:CR=1 FL=1
MPTRLMIYGCTGYTGKLIAQHAKERGLDPILAGRNRAKVEAVAAMYDLEHRVFPAQSAAQVAGNLVDVACVLSVAGPFSATANAMMNGSIDAGAHYLDVTGEIDVFELGFSLSSRAADRGVMVLPGVGFDVVPSDCLVAHAVTVSYTHLTLPTNREV